MDNELQNSELQKSLKLIAKSSIIVFIGIFLSKIFAYLYRIVIARHFGPEGYGLFSLAIVIVGWFTTIAALGINQGIARYIPYYRGKKEENKINYLFRFSLIISCILGILGGIILFFTADFISVSIFHDANLIFFLKISSVLIPLTLLASIFLYSLLAFEKIAEHSFIFNILQNVAKVLFLFIFIFLGIQKNSIIYSYLLGILATLTASYFYCKYKIPNIFLKPKIDDNEKKQLNNELFKYSIPLLFAGIISYIFYWIDSFSIGYYKGTSAVGLYSTAVPIALLISIAPVIFLQLFFPLINKEYSKKNFNLIKQLSQQVSKWIFMVNLPILVLLVLFPGTAINLLFGSAFLQASVPLIILSIGAFISSVFLVSNQLVLMVGKSKIIFYDILIACLLNFILNSILVPIEKIWFIENTLGMNGAAIATTISIVVLNLLFLIQAKKYISIVPLKRKMLSISFSAILATLALVFLKSLFKISLLPVLILSGFFILFYIFLVVITKGFDKNDIMILKTIKNKIFIKAK